VYLSFIGAAAEATFTFARDHFRTEQYSRASGLAWTFSRQNLYMDLLPLIGRPERASSKVPPQTYGSYPCCAMMSPTRCRDALRAWA